MTEYGALERVLLSFVNSRLLVLSKCMNSGVQNGRYKNMRCSRKKEEWFTRYNINSKMHYNQHQKLYMKVSTESESFRKIKTYLADW